MRISIRGKVLLAGACMMAGLGAWGQTPSLAKPASSSIDVAVTYDTVRGSTVPGSSFWMQGGSVQFHGQFWRGLGVVADVAGVHTANMHNTGVGLDLITATFGPRYTWQPKQKRMQFFGQALGGVANGLNSVFPGAAGAQDSANSLALQVGGGMNVPVSRRVAVRAFEADWLRTQLPNATGSVQNNLRLGAGLVFKF